MKGAEKVIFNTTIIYTRVAVTSLLTLYSTRIVLENLGRSDYGIFTLVSGIILMLSFISTAMTTSTQRHLSFELGKEKGNVDKIFANSLLLHIIIAFLSVSIFLIGYFFFFDDLLEIPNERITAAKYIYFAMVISVMFTVIIVPYNALLVANEDMVYLSITGVVNVLLSLLLALSLSYINQDKLIYYGLATCFINITIYLSVFLYCKKKYLKQSLLINRNADINVLKELLFFGGWSLYGSLSTVFRLQGVAVILNMFLGIVVNAAYAIATQVTNQLNFFSNTMLWALNPQIMKSEAENNRERLNSLCLAACKFGFILLAFIVIPILFEIRAILGFWLKNYPYPAEYFCSFMLIAGLINQLTVGLKSAAQATDKIKLYEFTTGSILILNIPLVYLLLYYGVTSSKILSVFVFVQLLSFFTQLFMMRKISGLSLSRYFKFVVARIIFPTLTSALTCFFITNFLDVKFRFVYTLCISITVFFITVYFTSLEKIEKERIKTYLKKITKY